jgi:hypothetical protein
MDHYFENVRTSFVLNWLSGCGLNRNKLFENTKFLLFFFFSTRK